MKLYRAGLPASELQNNTGIQDKNRPKYRKIQDKLCEINRKMCENTGIFLKPLRKTKCYSL